MENISAQGRYEQLRTERQPYLNRARECAAITLPYLFPPEGATGNTHLPTPFQSVGARGVNNLASKLLLALFPPGSPFFELKVDDFVVEELAAEDEDARGEVEAALGKIERAVSNEIDQAANRNKFFETLKNLIVGGNGLLERMENNRFRFFPLSTYVQHKNGRGEVVEIVVKEVLTRRGAPNEILELLKENPKLESENTQSVEAKINLYTWIQLKEADDRWHIHQEIGLDEDKQGLTVPGSESKEPKDKPSWLPLGMIEVDGEHYSRSYVEEYLGDLYSLERNTQSVTDFGAAASKIIDFVDPGSETDPDEYAEAQTGDVIEGRAEDVTTKTLDKYGDFQVVDAVGQRMEKRLEQVFLLTSSIQRDAERVTAEEVRRLANELDEQLGGVYSLLAEGFQLPLVRGVMHRMQKTNRLPNLGELEGDIMTIHVVTGIAAMGRNHDLARLDEFLRGIIEVAGPEAVSLYLNLGGYMKRRAAALNLDVEGMIRSEAEASGIRQQQQMAEAMKAAASSAVGYLDNRAAEANAQPTGE